MKINGNEIRPGNIIEHDGGLWVAVKTQHVKPGKGGAFVRTKIKNLRNGRVLEKTFRSGEKVNEAEVEDKKMQFLYMDGTDFVFMDSETYDQVPFSSAQMEESSCDGSHLRAKSRSAVTPPSPARTSSTRS